MTTTQNLTAPAGTYRPAGMTFLERQNNPTECSCCGRQGLKRTVKMVAPCGAIGWFGTGCAARWMGATAAQFAKAQRFADAEVATAEQVAKSAANAARTAEWFAWLDATAGADTDRHAQFARLGGFAAASERYHAEGGQF